jgi:hypothetical protein
MWEPRRLTTVWAFTTCYKGSFTFTFTFTKSLINTLKNIGPRTDSSGTQEISSEGEEIVPETQTWDCLLIRQLRIQFAYRQNVQTH